MKGISLVFFMVISWFSPVLGQEQFPSWVPSEAVQAAKEGWLRQTQLKSDTRLSISYGICREDLSRSRLQDPRKIVNIDYESYEPGSDILAMFSDTVGRYRNGFGFSVHIDGRCVGTVMVAMQNHTWMIIEISGVGNSAVDVFSTIYSRYAPADDLVIYWKRDGAFFISKECRIINAFYWDVATRSFKEIPPEEYIIMEKARTIEFKKSGYFRRCPQIGKEQPDSLLELTIPLSASLTAGEIGYDIESVRGDCSWKSNLCWAACAAGVMGADGVGEHQCSIVVM